MPPLRKQEQQLPMLLFLLEHKKYHELIKSIFNENISKKFLFEYGFEKYQISKMDQFKISQDAQFFTIEDLIEIKGSNFKKVKKYENKTLQETILRKLKSNYLVQPNERNLYWLQFTDIYNEPHLYEGLAQLQLPPETQHILDKDIKRTYYNLPTQTTEQKQKQNQALRLALKQSLSRFALYNPFLLYCQGMNEVFGFLHEQNFNPKESFFIFKRITEVLLPSDYYSSLEGIVSYMKVLWEMISISFPKIHHKLNFIIKEMDLSGNYLCVFSHVLQWFVCLFTNTMLDREIRKTIMDYFLLQGITVLFKASLAIFQYLQDTILKAKSFQSYVMKVEQAVRKYNNVNHLRIFLNEKFISKQILFLMKEYVTSPQQFTQKKMVPFTKKCYKKWNFCLQQLQNNFHSQHKYDFFVFKGKQNVKIIPEYLNKLNSYYFDRKKNFKPVDMLKIGRIAHICKNISQEGTEDSLSEKNNNKKESAFTNRDSPSSNQGYQLSLKQSSSGSANRYIQTKFINSFDLPHPEEFKTDNEPEPKQPTYAQDFKQKLSISNIADDDDTSVYHRKQTLEYREMIKQKLLQETERKTLQKSQSMMFMKMMVDNQSYSNLFSLLQNEEMDMMFDIGSESDEQGLAT